MLTWLLKALPLLIAAVFSRFKIYVDGREVEHWNNAVISSQVADYGMSGCCSVMFSFTSFKSMLQNARKGAPVRIVGINAPDFTIQSRQINGDECVFTCIDLMKNVDDYFDDEWIEDGGVAAAGDVLSHLCEQCNYSGYVSTASEMSSILSMEFDKSNYSNKTCRTILEEFSKAMLGYWIMSGDTLKFVGFGSGAQGTNWIDVHSKINYGNAQAISGLIMKCSATGDIFKFGSNSSKMIESESIYATVEIAQSVFNRISSYYYEAWSCDNGIVTGYVGVDSMIKYSTADLIANNVQLKLSGDKVYANLGKNTVSETENEYKSTLQREIGNKIEPDKVVNGSIVFRNKNNGGSVEPVKTSTIKIFKNNQGV